MIRKLKNNLLAMKEAMQQESNAAKKAYIGLGVVVCVGCFIQGSVLLNRAANVDSWQRAFEDNAP